MGKIGFPNYLIELLSSIECNDEDKASIAHALAELACNTQNKIIMVENDVLDLLIDMLDSRNERCKELAACALASAPSAARSRPVTTKDDGEVCQACFTQRVARRGRTI